MEPTREAVVSTASATPEPLAASVNGEGILLVDYEAEVLRLQSAIVETGSSIEEDEVNDLAINELIDQVLLAQTARENGYQLTDDELDKQIGDLAQEMGGMDALASWQAQNNYSDDSFRRWMRIGIEAAWQQNQWLATIPATADQVHVRQIFVKEEGEANSAYQQLEAGANFLELAAEYDSLTGGDLAWLIPGYVLYPELDEAIFQLDVGQHSPIIKTEIGYHIVYIEAKESNRDLTPDLQDKRREQIFRESIQELRNQSTIELFIDK